MLKPESSPVSRVREIRTHGLKGGPVPLLARTQQRHRIYQSAAAAEQRPLDAMTNDQIVPKLLQACPEAKDAWEQHLSFWGGEERGLFNDVAVFADHIVEGFTVGDTVEFEAFFLVLEEMIESKDETVRALGVIGLIEGIQNIASHQAHGYSVFVPWLGPRSKEAWAEVEKMWSGVGSLADMIRRERGV